MQLNFEKQNLKSCNGSLRFIRKGSIAISCLCYNLMQFCAYVAIQCNLAVISAIFAKKSFWANNYAI